MMYWMDAKITENFYTNLNLIKLVFFINANYLNGKITYHWWSGLHRK